MNTLLFGFDIVKKFRSLCLSIDEIIYGLVNNLFSVFNVLAETRLFSSKVITDFTNRIYIILSVVMLFALTYAIMTVIINPDKAANSDKSGFGIVKRVIIALVVLVFTPTIFDFGYSIQQSVIDNNVIGKVILGRTEGNTTEELKGEFVVGLFQGSFYTTDKAGDLALLEYADASLSAKINGDLSAYEDLLDYIDSGQVKYNNVVSLIVGCFALYCLVIFCFDLGVRCAKLAFFEMIAPVPALLYIVPGKESSFKTWSKEVLSTFFEVFVRVGIIYFITYAFYLLNITLEDGSLFGELALPGSTIGFLVKLFIILGLLVFALRAPKLITDMLGIKSEGILSFKKRWDEAKQAVVKTASVATTPVRSLNRPAAAIAGHRAAMKAYNVGLASGNKGNVFKKTLAGFHGLRNGFTGGLRNVGKAYDYELAVQDSYAHNRNKSTGAQIWGGITDSLRDNFGFGSRYDYIKKRAEIERDFENAPRLESVNNLRRASDQQIQKINNDHKSYIDDNKAIFDAIVKRDEVLEKELGKASSKEVLDQSKLTAKEAVRSKTNAFKTVYVDSTGKKQSWNYSEYYEERAKLVKAGAPASEISRIDAAISSYLKDYSEFASMCSGVNWAGLEEIKERANRDTTISKEERNKIVNAVECAKDALKIQYNDKDESDQLSAYVTAKTELRNLLSLKDTKAGLRTVTDADGNVIGSDKNIKGLTIEQLRDMVDTGEAFGLKKIFGKLVDDETASLNNALANAKITEDVVYYDDDGKRLNARDKSLLEVDRIIKDRVSKTEEKNRATEKLIESYVSDKVNAENQKSRRDMLKNISNSGKDKKH